MLPVRVDLAVLSACNTAQGRVIRGEGPMGLSRSFLAAGARRVLVSLWSVSDLSTATLMARFHSEIESGKPADQALRASKLWLMEQTFRSEDLRGPGGVAYAGLASRPHAGGERERDALSVRHPFFWAPFILVGMSE